jgi:hypothetical protein
LTDTPARPAAHPSLQPRAQAALNALEALLAQCDRPDLENRATASAARLAQSSCTVLVVGEFKKGKSSLVNALLNAPICPVDDDEATARPIEIRYGEAPVASVVYRLDDTAPDGTEPVVREIAFEELHSYTVEPLTAPDADQVGFARVALPRHLLSSGLVIIDTPGVGGLGSAHSAVTVGALPQADAVLFVVDASQELTASEMEFLRTVRAMCPTFVCVLTKVDFYPAWRRIADLDREHLQRHGVDCRLIPTSATLRTAAVENNDRELNIESGYGELVAFLRDEVASEVERATLNRMRSEVGEVLDHLEAQLRTELAVLDDPEESGRLVRQLESAKERAERLRSQAARWQQTLNDGTADLVADVEHDLRSRFRELIKEAEESIDGFDPAKAWDEFEPWLSRRATSDVVSNYTFLQQRAVQLAGQVAIHFDADHREIAARLEMSDPAEISIEQALRSGLKLDRPSPFAQAVSAMRGTAGGMLMLNAFSAVAGVALAAPFIAGVGLVLGRKMLKDERVRQLAQRRLLAKQAVRKYTDDLVFSVGKDSRDTLRRINRQLRDTFLQRAEELTTSSSESLMAAQQAVRSNEQTRTQRRRDVLQLLDRMAEVRKAFVGLGAEAPAGSAR